jgi:hypothetical protein
MKKILLVSILLIPLMLMTNQIAYSGVEPPDCGANGWTLIGPPVVGTWVVDFVGYLNGSPSLLFEFKGCCADCFENCKASCNVRIKWTDNILGIMPEEIRFEDVNNYNIAGRGPKNCNPIVNGTELKDLVVTTFLKFDNQSDIDGDGVIELVTEVVMYYWVCQ